MSDQARAFKEFCSENFTKPRLGHRSELRGRL